MSLFVFDDNAFGRDDKKILFAGGANSRSSGISTYGDVFCTSNTAVAMGEPSHLDNPLE